MFDTLRAYARSIVIPRLEAAEAGEPVEEDHGGTRAQWERIREMLPTAREQRVAYLLFHCGLQLEDIVRLYPHELGDRQDIRRVRRTVIERLLASWIPSTRTGQQVVSEEATD